MSGRAQPKEAPKGLHLRGGVWHARTTVRVGDRSERIRETSGFARADLAKAEVWLRRRISEVENELLYGPAPEKADNRLSGFATAAADYAEKGGKRGPLGKQDLAKLERLGIFFGEKPCNEIGEDDWDDFVGACLCERDVPVLRAGRQIGQRHVPTASPDTERRWFSMFRAPLGRELRRHGLALREFDVPPASAGRLPPFLNRAAEATLLAAYQTRQRPVAEMLAWQGCRVMEALRLRLPHDIDFTAETITFRDTKNGTDRTVPMDPRVKRSLRRHLGQRRLGPVFPTPQGEAYNDRHAASHGTGKDGGALRTAHASALRRAAMAGFRVHDWRHHFAVWFLIRGGSETELMQICGWTDRRMVDRYAKLPIEHLRKTLLRGTSLAQRRATGA